MMGWLLVAPALAILGLAFLWPLLVLARMSLNRTDDGGALVPTLGTETYAKLADDTYTWALTADSLRLAAVSATVALLLAYPMALFLYRSRSRFRGVLAVAAVAPLLVSGTARVIGWLTILGDNGLVNAAIAAVGLPRQALINNWTGVQIGLTESVMPYTVLALLAGFGRLDRRLGSGGHPRRPSPDRVLDRHGAADPTGRGRRLAAGVRAGRIRLHHAEADGRGAGVHPGHRDLRRGHANPGLAGGGGVVDLRPGPARRNPGRAGRPGPQGAGLKVGGITAMLAACGYGFMLAPLAVVIVLSFSAGPYLSFPPPGLSLRWYAALLDNGPVLQAAGRSVILAGLVMVVSLLAGFPAALAVARRQAPAWVAGALSLPLLLPTLVIGLALLMVLQPLGLLATWPGLALGHLAVVLPFVVRLLVTAFATLPPDLEDAAATLGARPLRAFLLVTLPLAAPGAIAAATLSFLLSFDETVISLFLVGPRLTTLPVALFHYAESRVDPLLAALAVVLIALAVTIVLVVDRLVGFTRTVGKT